MVRYRRENTDTWKTYISEIIEPTPIGPKISTRCQVNLPARTLTIVNANTDKTQIGKQHLYDAQFAAMLEDEHIN